MVVAAVICCVLFSPPSYSAQWDPSHPPISVIRQPNLDQPSGDDGGWGDIEKSGNGWFIWCQLDLWACNWIISSLDGAIVEPTISEPTVVIREGAHEGASAPTGRD